MGDEEDLEDILIGIQLQQVYALFDDESEVVYVLSDATNIGAAEELGYVSAYLGAVQQGLFDIAELRRAAREGGSDQFRAVTALIGGDVAQVATGYITTVFTREQVERLKEPLPENKLLTAPSSVMKDILFAQREGADFVAELFGTAGKGWDGVNEAYRRPPISTEQVLHPEKYFADEAPQTTVVPGIAAELGKGWSRISANTMGEFLLRSYLEEELDDIQAAEAAAGWGGDRYALLNGPEGQRLLVSIIGWDTFQDAAEFFNAYQVFAGIKVQEEGGSTTSLGDSGRKWSTPDRTIFMGRTGATVLLIVGDDEGTVGTALELLFEALAALGP